jgi:hypothetical protein
MISPSPISLRPRGLIMFERWQRLGFRLGPDLIPNLLQGADTRRERISVIIDDVPQFPFESGGLFVCEFEVHPPGYGGLTNGCQ